MKDNRYYHWDEFVDWCEDNGIKPSDSTDEISDFDLMWKCWQKAVDTKEEYGELKCQHH